MGKPQARKPLPQFSSRQESVAFYEQYGKLEPWGQLFDGSTLYTLKVSMDGRLLRLKFFDDGRVEELVF